MDRDVTESQRIEAEAQDREEGAQAPLEDALRPEPDWAGTLSVAPIDLDDRRRSPN
ncbi:MAG: hypothetical protein ACJ74M_08245 [Gaiellaceae bacterium]